MLPNDETLPENPVVRTIKKEKKKKRLTEHDEPFDPMEITQKLVLRAIKRGTFDYTTLREKVGKLSGFSLDAILSDLGLDCQGTNLFLA